MKSPRIVIVGNSAAGLAALRAIRRLDADCPVTLVDAEPARAYSRVMLPYLVSGEREDLSLQSPEEERTLGARRLLGRRAVSVESDRVRLDDGTALPFDRLLLATGSRAAIPDIEGIQASGVHALKTMADALAIRARLPSARRVVVLGGGLICLLVVRAFLTRGLAVTVAVSSDRLLSRLLDAEGAAMVQRRLVEAGVRILTRTDVAQIVAHDGAVRAVVTAAGEELPADLVILAKGIRADTEVARASGLAVGRGVLVDGCQRTSRPEVFAAGDCAEAPDLVVPARRTVAGTWFEAVAQGETAGTNMLAVSRPGPGALRMNVMGMLGLAMASIGVTEAQNAQAVTRRRAGAYRKLTIAGDRIVGAVLVGDVTEAGPITMLIRHKVALSALKRFDPQRPIRYADLTLH